MLNQMDYTMTRSNTSFRFKLLAVASSLMLSVGAAHSSSAAEQEKVRVAVEGGIPPFN